MAVGTTESLIIGNNDPLNGPIGLESGYLVLPYLLNQSFADNTSAALGGVPLGGVYRSGTVLSIRTA
jgi:hypothetical protein